MDKKFYTVHQAAAELGVAKQTLYYAISRGDVLSEQKIQGIRPVRLIPFAEVKRLKDAQKK